LQDGFVELESFFDGDFNIKKLIFSLDELVQGLELTDVFFSQPFSHFSKLGSNGAFLVSIEFFNHDVVFVLQKLFDFVDSSVINGLYGVAVEFAVTKL
jgi:hypothetical protein